MSEHATVATWNVNSIKMRADHLERWLGESRPGLAGIQELKTTEEAFPREPFEALGYRAEVFGQKTWNGVAFLSPDRLEDVQRGIPESPEDPQSRILAATWRGIRVYNLYVPNGQAVGSDKYAYKLEWLDALYRHVTSRHSPGDRLILMGDFNIAPADRDVYDPEKFRDQVLFSGPEHEALGRFLNWGLVDLFRLTDREPGLFSWWDYRGGAFWKNQGARIDLILATQPLAERTVSCDIDLAPRKWSKSSDHTPVVARFRLD